MQGTHVEEGKAYFYFDITEDVRQKINFMYNANIEGRLLKVYLAPHQIYGHERWVIQVVIHGRIPSEDIVDLHIGAVAFNDQTAQTARNALTWIDVYI